MRTEKKTKDGDLRYPRRPLPVRIETGILTLDGDLTVPPAAKGLVIFAHGSGSSRKSPRNRFVASQLNNHGLASLLADLLTPEEEEFERETRHLRFDIPLLADRLESITKWAGEDSRTGGFNIGYFGASTGAAAALIGAAHHPRSVRAVVSRGGRPDLAGDFLPLVKAPTLLIAGTHDQDILRLNREALAQLNPESAIRLVSGATHLFEEPGALEQVSELAAAWFTAHIG
jgi:putative phosphoribosyl transferase